MLNFPPGAIAPEFQAPPTDVCVMESLLVHVTLPPTETVTGFGAKAVVVIVAAPETMDTAVPEPDDASVGEVMYVDDEQPTEIASSRVASTIRRRMVTSLSRVHQGKGDAIQEARVFSRRRSRNALEAEEQTGYESRFRFRAT